MPLAKPLTVDDLWKIKRLGLPSLSPDGRQAVCAVTAYSMAENNSASTLWLMPTQGRVAPRALTQCGSKDGQPRFSPQGDAIGFIAKREQQGSKDEQAQFYVIPSDGGEARRVGSVATGVEAFKWFPDGRRIAFISWVWPEERGAAAQAKRHKAFKARKETAYVTSQGHYRFWDHFVPMGRVAHLHVLDIATGRVTDLFEGTPYELTRNDPDALQFDLSPDGQRIAFACDPLPDQRMDARFVIAEVDLPSRRVALRVQAAEWDCRNPSYSPDGNTIAFTASHQGLKHTMPDHLALWQRATAQWQVVSADWDHAVQAPLRWPADGQALLFTAEQHGRTHVWRFDLATRGAECVVQGGWVQGFDLAAGTLVSLADSVDHPAQLSVHVSSRAPRRIEAFNNALLAKLDLGRHEEVWITGALGEPVQMWVYYPPGFNPRRKYPLLHSIHGGPHSGPGDNWHYRWNYKLFAAQGYVVVQVNYHGSSGFGHAFLDSITHRWGELELQDVEAGTDWMLRQPYIDGKRLFATGGSYGGYMVAWMNTQLPVGRYQAYVCHAGCYDWTAMFADDGYLWFAKELGAWYWQDPAKLAAQSPHAHAGGLTTPTLVMHGALDYRVPDQQGLAYYNTLQARGIESRLVWFPDENHWILKPRNHRLWHAEFFAWLRAHDPAHAPRKSTVGARRPAKPA